MKKVWSEVSIEELTFEATRNIPTELMAADDYQDGYFIQGIRETSGDPETIIYKPAKQFIVQIRRLEKSRRFFEPFFFFYKSLFM